jgi:valyl-tRNA synthetase
VSLDLFSKPYEPGQIETLRREKWETDKVFKSQPNSAKKPYTIVMPPPNVTGDLTMGHVINNTLQDILIRWNRGMGKEACWIPGTDHASIATEAKVTKLLQEKGIQKRTLKREEFLEHAWEWKNTYGNRIVQVLKKLGISCDWDREVFTMDKSYSDAVIKAIVKLYKDGLIYRGTRLVNWCPVSQSVISDEEVIPEERSGNLWHIRYLIEDSSDYLVVATTRPETLFGDLAVAVHPNDERYKKYIGKNVILPTVGKKIPIIADSYVEQEFGTGVVKITPAHDKNDYEVGKRHQLGLLNVMNPDATLNANVPSEFVGLDRFDARKKLVKQLQDIGQMEKIEPYKVTLGISERGAVPIEYYLSEQWYIKMDGLAKLALEDTQNQKLTLFPKHYEKTWDHWLNHIQDWCISRQLWWGHQMPMYTCQSCKHVMCEVSAPTQCEQCGNTHLVQDPDCLDTWASSWLWPFGVHQWANPSEQNKKDLEYYYPTDIIVTGPDIIFFWIARMVMAGKYFTNQSPFSTVYFTPLIRDSQGRKMSKSLGNSPNVFELMDKYGTDALRFAVVNQIVPGQDVFWSDSSCDMGKNFSNKLWNVTRYFLMAAHKLEIDVSSLDLCRDFDAFNPEKFQKNYEFFKQKHETVFQNKSVSQLVTWIMAEFFETVGVSHRSIHSMQFSNYTFALYEFSWFVFCDWFVELTKPLLAEDQDRKTARSILDVSLFILNGLLKLAHPIMPFITEEISNLVWKQKDELYLGEFALPQPNSAMENNTVTAAMRNVQSVVNALRTIRGQYKLHPGKVLDVFVETERPGLLLFKSQMEFLAKANIVFGSPGAELVAVGLADGEPVYVNIEGVVEPKEESDRLRKKLEKVAQTLQGIEKKLQNQDFVKGAPPNIIQGARKQQSDLELERQILEKSLARLP